MWLLIGNIPNFTLMLFLLLKMYSALCSILQFIKHCEPNQNLKQRTSHSTTVSLNEKNKNQQHTHTTVYVFF